MLPWQLVMVGFLCSFWTLSTGSDVFQLRLEMNEEEKEGTVIADMVNVFGLRWEERAGREFELFDSQRLQTSHGVNILEESLVEINRDTGIITQSRRIDRDALCGQDAECVLKIQAIMRPTRHFQLLQLDVVIRDVNDNHPVFPNDVIVVNVSENAHVNDAISISSQQARDSDAGNNSAIEYSLSNNQYFEVEHSIDEIGRPQLQLILLRKLDYEGQASFQFNLVARDNGQPPKSDHVMLQVNVIDENDNAPVFEQYHYIVKKYENLSPGAELVSVHATDLDTGLNGLVDFNIVFDLPVPQNAIRRDFLSIDTATGRVQLLGRLNYEKHNGLEFRIEATDRGKPPLSSQARITLIVGDVNDHVPVIKEKFVVEADLKAAYLSESSPLGTYVAYINVKDADYGNNGEVEVAIVTKTAKGGDEDSGHFRLDPDGLIQTEKEFDCEAENRYYVIIIACDKGEPPRCSQSNVTIEILDENDNSPAFNPSIYEITMSEGDAIGTDVIKVVASDDDTLNAPVIMQNELGERVPSTYGRITYSIKDNDVFSIDPRSGQVVLARPLDWEGHMTWEITITASDGGFPPRSGSCLLKVNVNDINDNPPIFLTPIADNSTVYASILLDQPIIELQVVDYDSYINSDVTMNVVAIDGVKYDDVTKTNLFSVFLLDEESGELYLNLSHDHLEDILGEHYVVVQAIDNGDPPLMSRMGTYVRVTDDLVLPDVVDNPQHNVSQSGLSYIFLIIILASVALLLFIIMLVIVVIFKHKKGNKKDRSYSCSEAEHKSGYSQKSSIHSSKQDYIPNGYAISPSDSDVMQRHITRTKSSSLSSNQTQANKDPLSTLSAREQLRVSNPEIYQLLPRRDSSTSLDRMCMCSNIVTSQSDSVTQNKQCLSSKDPSCLSRVTSSQVDKDSGQGDSEVDASCWHTGQERRILSNYDATSQINNLGRFCTPECTRYGHSDACWMPETGELREPMLPRNNSKGGLETIRENPLLSQKRVAVLPYAPAAARDRLRKSLCLALMGAEGHHHQPFRSEPTYHRSEDLYRLKQIWGEEADTPYSSVFGSGSSSPAPTNGRCNSSSCEKDKIIMTSENEALLRPEHYLSLVGAHRSTSGYVCADECL